MHRHVSILTSKIIQEIPELGLKIQKPNMTMRDGIFYKNTNACIFNRFITHAPESNSIQAKCKHAFVDQIIAIPNKPHEPNACIFKHTLFGGIISLVHPIKLLVYQMNLPPDIP
jgi:hypothetical protein